MTEKMTLEKLALMVNKGFESVRKDINGLRLEIMHIKGDVSDLWTELRYFRNIFEEFREKINLNFRHFDDRFTIVEKKCDIT